VQEDKRGHTLKKMVTWGALNKASLIGSLAGAVESEAKPVQPGGSAQCVDDKMETGVTLDTSTSGWDGPLEEKEEKGLSSLLAQTEECDIRTVRNAQGRKVQRTHADSLWR
jgi:hypothetical protein